VIADILGNAHRYRDLSPRIARAFDYLGEADLRGALGTFTIDGDRLYAMIQEYETIPAAHGCWEAHRRYIDLQYVVDGSERIGYAHLDRLAAGTYDPERDFLPLRGAGDFLTLNPGDFMLLFPEDAHLPRIAVAAPAPVRKVVVKIAVAP
jgi:YhcH/YjgK/YiaL family protein